MVDSVPPAQAPRTLQGTELNMDNLSQLEKDLAEMKRLGYPDAEARQLLEDLKKGNLAFVSASGHSTTGAMTLEQFKQALENRSIRVIDSRGMPVANSEALINSFKERVNSALDRMKSMSDAISSMRALKSLCDSGDILGAIMMVMTSRAKTLDNQLTARIGQAKSRNSQIDVLTDDINDKQGKMDKMKDDNPEKKKLGAEIKAAQGKIQSLNNESQLETMMLNSDMGKRNQCFELMSNCISTFKQTNSTIINNAR
jgi:hypothetical protein